MLNKPIFNRVKIFMERLRKMLVVSVMSITVLSMSMLAVPMQVGATASAGDLIKMSGLSSVYYLGADGERYVFPNEQTYFSWYSDFSGVVTIPQSELESYSLGANVTIRPGTVLVKITTNPKVYAVEPNGNLKWVSSETAASTLFGANWAARVVDVPDAFFTNYTVASGEISDSAYPTGSLVKWADSTDVYYVDSNGEAQKIANEAAFLANRFKWSDVITAPTSVVKPTAGTEITGAVATLTDTSSGAGGTAGAGTGLTVALASDTPASATVPSSAVGVPFTKFNITASNDGDITVNSIIVKRTGIGKYDDLSKVYIYDGATRLSTGKTIGASTNEATFTNLGLAVAKGTTKTLTITADIAAYKTGNHALGIAAATGITTNGATVAGTFPVTGNTMSLSGTNVGKVDVETSQDYTRKVGETGVEVANMTVTVDSTEDASFKGITIYNSDDDVVSNLKLYRGSTLLATATKSGRNHVFVLDTPYDITKSDSASFTIKGDVSGKAADTAILYVRYNTDVVVVGKTYGYNLGIDQTLNTDVRSSIDESATTLMSSTTTVQAGQLTLAINGPSAQNVSENSNDVVLMNFNMTSQSAVDFSKITIDLIGNSEFATADVDDLELVCDGVAVESVATVAELSEGTTSSNALTNGFSLPAGKTVECSIRVDITNTAGGDETIQARILDLTSTSNATIKTADNDTITDIVPSGNITGNVMTVTAASLTINVASAPAAGSTYVKGATDAAVTGFAFTAGAAADVKVTSIQVTAYLSDAASTTEDWMTTGKDHTSGAEDVIVAVSLYDGATATLLGKKSLTVGSADITATFDALNVSIPKGTSKAIIAKADISTNGPKSSTNDTIAFAINTAGDVTSEYGSGTNLGPTLSGGNTTPTIYQIVASNGTLTMARDASSPQANLVLAGTTGYTYTIMKFTSTLEDYVISKLRVTNSANDSNFTSISLEYKNQAGTTLTATSLLVSGVADFTDLSMYVPKDGSALVSIKGNMNTISGGAANGNASTLGISGTDGTFEASGQASGGVITDAGSDTTGLAMSLYEAYPTVAFAANTPSGNLIPGANTVVGIINITANGSKNVVLDSSTNQLVVNFSQAGGANGTTTVSLIDNSNGNILCTATPNLTTTAFTCDFATNTLTVPAGTTASVNLVVDTTTGGWVSEGESIQAYLDDASNDNIIWGIDGTGDYATGVITFRGDKFGGTLVKP